MTDLLANASDWLSEQMVRYLSRPVTYCRGAATVEVNAAVGRTVFEVDDGTGLLECFESRDYLVKTAQLVFGGEPVVPEPGDRVREAANGRVYVYEVLAPGRRLCWRYSDPHRRMRRIHAKLVAME